MASMMLIGQIILKYYEVVDILRAGGQAYVAKAVDKRNGQCVVIKQLATPDEDEHFQEQLDRFTRVAGLRVNHPVIVDAIDFGCDGGDWYTVFPFIDGTELQLFLVRNGGRLPIATALNIICQVAEGLAALHDKGIVHRDLKPGNILVSPNGAVHIIDLGICHCITQETITAGNALLGSVPWMSPEQLKDPTKVDHRSDLYSLALIAYAVLTGHPPVSGVNVGDLAYSILQAMPPRLQEHDGSIPAHVDEAVMTMLAKEPTRRFQSVEEFVLALSGTSFSTGRTRFCLFCGRPRGHTARFCSDCGASLQEDDAPRLRCAVCTTQVNGDRRCAGCRRDLGSPHHHLVVYSGPLAGHTLIFPQGDYDLGRPELEPRDCLISRRHFHVHCTDATLLIQDLGSTNGTWVAGRVVRGPVRLQSGQEIAFGGNRGTYSFN